MSAEFRRERNEDELGTRTIKVERKLFHFDLKQNPRGAFLKITEESSGKRDVIILPSTGIADFVDAIQQLLDENPEVLDILEETEPEEND